MRMRNLQWRGEYLPKAHSATSPFLTVSRTGTHPLPQERYFGGVQPPNFSLMY